MAKTVGQGNNAKKQRSSMICPTCGIDMVEHGWAPVASPRIFHCEGSTVEFGAKKIDPHHSRWVWPSCWRCGESLGCGKCATSDRLEVLCTKCIVWGTEAAFLHHGPILNDPGPLARRGGRRAPSLSEYPSVWARRYNLLPPL